MVDYEIQSADERPKAHVYLKRDACGTPALYIEGVCVAWLSEDGKLCISTLSVLQAATLVGAGIKLDSEHPKQISVWRANN